MRLERSERMASMSLTNAGAPLEARMVPSCSIAAQISAISSRIVRFSFSPASFE
jgi:hypothetical protein